MRTKIRTVGACVVGLWVVGFGTTAAAQDCPGPETVDLELLYSYSQLAEIAYGKEPKNSCDVEDLHSSARNVLEVPRRTLDADDYARLDDSAIRVWVEDNPGGSTGVQWITCRRDTLDPSFAASISQIGGESNDENAPGPTYVYRLARVVRRGVLTERLGVVLRQLDGTEQLLAIRGTEWVWSRILPNVLNALGQSCVFEVAAEIIATAEKTWAKPIAVAGHSLGGSVAQFVAQDRADRDPENVGPFSAYSFNGLGLERPVRDLPGLYSYQVIGEFVRLSEPLLGRRQGGNVIRYVPPRDWRPVFRFAWPPFDVVESERRHRLKTVQHSLCECAEGRGRVEYEGSRRRP